MDSPFRPDSPASSHIWADDSDNDSRTGDLRDAAAEEAQRLRGDIQRKRKRNETESRPPRRVVGWPDSLPLSLFSFEGTVVVPANSLGGTSSTQPYVFFCPCAKVLCQSLSPGVLLVREIARRGVRSSRQRSISLRNGPSYGGIPALLPPISPSIRWVGVG